MILASESPATNGEHSQIEHFLSVVWNSFSITFFFTILVSMWVAFRGGGRQFVETMPSRAFVIGLLVVPSSLFVVANLLEMICYGSPTQSSPGLEIQLAAAFISGELFVGLSSRPASALLQPAE